MKNLKGLLFLTLLAAYSSQASTDCEQLLRSKLSTDLELGYTEFDQTMNSGWRTLPQHQCYQEAAQLITAYIDKHQSQQRSLKWHLFQMQAFAGQYEQALIVAPSVLSNEQDQQKSKLAWNDYVLASVAFLQSDLDKIKQHRSAIAARIDEHRGNGMNLKIVDNLINGFGKPYRLAYNGQ